MSSAPLLTFQALVKTSTLFISGVTKCPKQMLPSREAGQAHCWTLLQFSLWGPSSLIRAPGLIKILEAKILASLAPWCEMKCKTCSMQHLQIPNPMWQCANPRGSPSSPGGPPPTPRRWHLKPLLPSKGQAEGGQLTESLPLCSCPSLYLRLKVKLEIGKPELHRGKTGTKSGPKGFVVQIIFLY